MQFFYSIQFQDSGKLDDCEMGVTNVFIAGIPELNNV